MDALDADPAGEPPPRGVRGTTRDLTSQQRRNIVSTLLLSVKPGDPEMKLARGVINSRADAYDVRIVLIRKNLWSTELQYWYLVHWLLCTEYCVYWSTRLAYHGMGEVVNYLRAFRVPLFVLRS